MKLQAYLLCSFPEDCSDVSVQPVQKRPEHELTRGLAPKILLDGCVSMAEDGGR